jgi:hypothetical protein
MADAESVDDVVDGIAVPRLSPSDQPGPAGRIAPDPMLHWVYLGMALGVIFLAIVLRVEGEEHVVVPLFNKPLPGTCTFKRITGFGCPGCGLTRSFVCLARGDVVRAWHFNPIGLGVAVLVVTQVPYRIVQLNRIRRGLPEFRAGRLMNWTFLLLAVGLFLQWIWRLSAGGP